MIAGSREFYGRLLASLRGDPRLRAFGVPEIVAEERVSRNTVIYRCRAGSTRLVAKAQTTRDTEVAVAEYEMLRRMAGIFQDGRIHGLHPVALYEELGVLVTKEEDGESLRSVIEGALDSPDSTWDRARAGVEAAADALRLFHEHLTQRMDGEGRDGVRCYMDFSTKNILIRWTDRGLDQPEIVLMDPPECEIWGEPTDDIGVFCFDLARIRFAPKFALKPSTSRSLDRLKARFIRRYLGPVGPEDLLKAVDRIVGAERRRAKQVLRWYCRPWRYRPVIPEVARLLYLGPLTAAYVVAGSRLSALRLKAALRDQSELEAYGDRAMRA